MRIGIDLGGTKIEAVALDRDGSELRRRRVPTPREYEATLAAVADLVHQFEHQLGCVGTVGLGIPGTISRATGLVKNANSVWLIGHPLQQDLSRRLEREVKVANDANCFALSEATDGAGKGAEVVFAVILGTGVGGGIVHRGRLLVGPNAIAGEWGHNPLPWPQDEERPGSACYCGRRGCIETFLSGPALARDYREAGGERVDAVQVLSRATDGEPGAEAAVRRYEDRLARALASVINVIDPDVIVLGGGLSNVGRLYHHVPQRWSAFVFSDSVETRLVQARHGDSSGVRGAAWLWPLEEAERRPS